MLPSLCFQIEDEIKAVKAVADGLCPLSIRLDRVVLTSTGVLLGCWQVCSLAAEPMPFSPSIRRTGHCVQNIYDQLE